MISTNELRIGNNVIFNGDFIGTIQAIREDTECPMVAMYWVKSLVKVEDLQPMPLTPEILLACGFKKYGDTDDLQSEYSIDYWITFDRVKMECRLCYDVEYHIEAPHLHIKFLHQLQNLYFALTGEELPYKP